MQDNKNNAFKCRKIVNKGKQRKEKLEREQTTTVDFFGCERVYATIGEYKGKKKVERNTKRATM